MGVGGWGGTSVSFESVPDTPPSSLPVSTLTPKVALLTSGNMCFLLRSI